MFYRGQRILVWEFAIGAILLVYSLSVVLHPIDHFSKLVSLALVGSMLMKVDKEGLRINIILALVAKKLLFISQVVLNPGSIPSTFLGILAVITSGAYLYSIVMLPTFNWPATRGRFRIGFKDKVAADDMVCALFYPTDEAYNEERDVFYADRVRWKDKVAAMTGMSGNLLLSPIIFIATHIYTRTRLGVIEDAPLAAECRKGLIPVLISHGFSNDRLGMSSLAREIASQGYLAICIDHRNEWTKETLAKCSLIPDKFWEMVVKASIKRPNDYKTVIETFSNLLPKRLPGDGEVEIDWSKVVGIGHSVGGDALIRSICLGRKFAACVAMDTFLHIDASLKSKGLSGPLLFLLAERTMIKHGKDPSIGGVEEMLSHSSKDVRDRSAYLMLKGQTHVNPADYGMFMPVELSIFSKWGMSLPSDVIPLYEIQNTLIVEFLARTVGKEASNLKREESMGNMLRERVKNSLNLEEKVVVRL
eukprot:TRINITY_DN2960_c0_g1_i1.p1 TRINITY_DN2960_c0_g1~~TRINITY_DN2960_c0_g1_i1.p1  ORF type:complete len:476 (-),score=90.82 TRINITY_DN2960_c0_g1_i1:190-1617(-)